MLDPLKKEPDITYAPISGYDLRLRQCHRSKKNMSQTKVKDTKSECMWVPTEKSIIGNVDLIWKIENVEILGSSNESLTIRIIYKEIPCANPK